MRIFLLFLVLTLISCKPDPDTFTQDEFKAALREELSDGDTLAAIALLDKYVEKFPDDLQAKVYNLGLKVKFGLLSEDDASDLIRGMDMNKIGGRVAEYNEVYATLDSIPPDSAIQKIDVLISRYPDDFYNYYAKGRKLLDLERYQEAIELFDKVLDIEPGHHYSRADKAFAQYMLGDKETACETWKTSMGGGASYRDKYCK